MFGTVSEYWTLVPQEVLLKNGNLQGWVIRTLRRPIRYNTLLIRNTRIIRKRIYAILGGTLGLY